MFHVANTINTHITVNASGMLVGIKKSAYTWTLFRNQGNTFFTIKLQQIKSVFLGHVCLKWITTDRGQAFNPVQIAANWWLLIHEGKWDSPFGWWILCVYSVWSRWENGEENRNKNESYLFYWKGVTIGTIAGATGEWEWQRLLHR